MHKTHKSSGPLIPLRAVAHCSLSFPSTYTYTDVLSLLSTDIWQLLRCNKNSNIKNIKHYLPSDYYKSGTKTSWGMDRVQEASSENLEICSRSCAIPNGRAWPQSPAPHSRTSHCLFMPWCLYCVHQCFSDVMGLYNAWESYKMQILIQYLCDETWGSVFLPGFQMMPMNQIITFLPHLLT